ncbi:16801_t:CDS:10 [Dentiscutata erythropus]|uniref:DNA 3'-5' helicase n=1 Tax=Dentiscutata erythropus TaxID=1348616 RepID=A0A9N9DSQ5_9GLOM|nr:16801_t:CDS:10 [Dentiscutata erythropus]
MTETKGIFKEAYGNLHTDYLNTFKLMRSGTIKVTKENIEKVKLFLETYNDLLHCEGLEVGKIEIKEMGKGKIDAVWHNKREMSRLLGAANHLYIKSLEDLNTTTTLKLHKNLISACDNTNQLLSAPLGGYICLQGKDQNNPSTWLPLLVEQSNNILVYLWNEYHNDQFNTIKIYRQDKALFYSLHKKYNLDKNYLISHVLGIAEPKIATELRNIEDQILRGLKRTSAEIETILHKNNESNLIIQHGIQLTYSDIPLSPKTSKFVHSEVVESYAYNSDKLRIDVQNAISNAKLKSTILVNTEQYITSIYTQLCSNCNDFNYSNRTCTLSKSGFLVKCEILCQRCNTITGSSNQNKNENLSKYVSAAALASEINRNALQSVLACIGITAQAGKTTYFDHQTHISQLIINHAKQKACGGKYSQIDIDNITKIESKQNIQANYNVSQIQKRNDKRKDTFENERIELLGFDFDKLNEYIPLFAPLIHDFNLILTCHKCYSFHKVTSDRLCKLYNFYSKISICEILNDNITKTQQLFEEKISLALKTIFVDRDVFVIMPTGSSKSLCYILSLIFYTGLTVVFSPLVSLIEDQISKLTKFGIPCSGLYTEQYPILQEKIFKEIVSGPAWGQLGCLKKLYPNAPIMMLTATCNFSRLEISYEVWLKKDSKDENIINMIEEIKKIDIAKCIVYCSTLFECKEISTALEKKLDLLLISIYHGDLSKEAYKYSLSQWQNNQIQIMITTSTFEIGIDMPDVKLIIHYTFPKTNLIQETGCAERNGSKATTIVYFSQQFNMDTSKSTILNKNKRLLDTQQKLFEVIYYLNEKYECRHYMLLRYYSWDALQDSYDSCNQCDNCQRRTTTDKVQQINVTNEIERILHVIEEVLNYSNAKIGPDDIVDIFLHTNNARTRAWGYDQLCIYNSD